MQVAEYVDGRQRIVTHVGSAHTEAELGVLLQRARELLADPAQGVLGFDVEPVPPVTPLAGAAEQPVLFEGPRPVVGGRDGPGRVLSTDARVLYDVLVGVYADLGFDAIGDAVFADLVIARVVEPTSLLDTGRVLRDLGRRPASYATMKRALARAGPDGGYRDQVAAACFAHAAASGDVTLCLYDVTTLYFEAEKEDGLRKVGYSKERRVDPQIVVGLLVDRGGFPLEIGCFEGNKAETNTILPVIRGFQARHGLADMVVVADAGMLSAGNLRKLDEASLRFIVGSRVTKAPIDLASHFRWHGDAFTDGQELDAPIWCQARCGGPSVGLRFPRGCLSSSALPAPRLTVAMIGAGFLSGFLRGEPVLVAAGEVGVVDAAQFEAGDGVDRAVQVLGGGAHGQCECLPAGAQRCLVGGGLRVLQPLEHLPCRVPFQAPDCVALGVPGGGPPGQVVHSRWVAVGHADDHDAVEGGVGLPVAATVQPAALGLAAGGLHGAGAAQGGERGRGAQPLGVVPGCDEQCGGGVGSDRRAVPAGRGWPAR